MRTPQEQLVHTDTYHDAHLANAHRGVWFSVATVVVGVFLATLFALSFILGIALIIPMADAQEANVGELRDKILDRNKQLIELQKEINEFRKQLQEVSAEKQTLESTVKSLDISRKKVSTDIEITETKISSTDLQIKQLELEILEKELHIQKNENALSTALRRVDELEDISIIETLMMHDSLADFWESLDELQQFQSGMQDSLVKLLALRADLEDAYDQQNGTKLRLSSLKNELAGEKQVLDATRKEKDSLLGKTKNEESNYQKLIAEKEAQRKQFEQELRTYEAQLKFVLNPTTVPTAGSGVFSWPFDSEYMAACPGFSSALGNAYCVTQYFGNTPFAKSGAYSGSGHNGIDFRAPLGTKIRSALAGTVVGVGDTDASPGCYSYGKWVMVRHNNGLSTLYAHLSTISVGNGQAIGTGDTVGFSGNTGYSTGPHLHFSVYATEGVKVQRLGDIPGRPITGCSPVAIPVAAHEAYMNPIEYLPYPR